MAGPSIEASEPRKDLPGEGSVFPAWAGAFLPAAASLVAALCLARAHPLAPGLCLAGVLGWSLAVWRWPRIWLFAVPGLLPILNFSPWTGWLIFDEFDLLLLASAAGGYAGLVARPRAREAGRPEGAGWLVLFGAYGFWALARGIADAGGCSFGWFQGYADPLNSLRAGKGLFFALLLLPLLQEAWQAAPERSARLVAAGMAWGLGITGLAVLWERAAFPGILNFTSRYRTAGLFWEMHVGGAALDGYLALAMPFAAWAFLTARRPGPRLAAAALTLLTGYACLTTFSRGLYLAVLISLVFLFRRRRERPAAGRWRRPGALLIALLLGLELTVVLSGGSFMAGRLNASRQDLAERLDHWRSGLGLMQTPFEGLFGKGLGRFPASYKTPSPARELPGEYRLVEAGGNAFMSLAGPPLAGARGETVRLSQRVGGQGDRHPRVRLEVRTGRGAALRFRLCEKHLLYEGPCLRGQVRVPPTGGDWRSVAAPLAGDALPGGAWYAPRLRFFAIDITGRGETADIDNISLSGEGGPLLRNGDFARGAAGWFPTLQHYFLPWHIDRLFLEVLFEQGLAGLMLFLLVLLAAFRRLLAGAGAHHPLAAFLAAALGGFLALGTVNSLLDVPRLAFLFYFLTALAACRARRNRGKGGARQGRGFPHVSPVNT